MSSSKISYEIARPTEADLVRVIENMHPLDVAEVWAAAHHTPETAVRKSVEVSRDTIKVGRADGEPVCIFGVASETVMSRIGAPWLLGTPDIEKHSRAFLRLNRAYIADLRRDYDFLANFVDMRNNQAIRWLQWLGFTLLDPRPYGVNQLMFHPFFMGDPNV